jgi:beta-glucanase (GH16 family)
MFQRFLVALLVVVLTPTPSAASRPVPPVPPVPPAGAAAPGAADPQPQGPGGVWHLTFADEFSGSTVDTGKWQFRSSAESDWSSTPFGTGNPGNQQLEFDQPRNCSVAGDLLSITARPDNITSQSGRHYRWSSCLLTSGYAYRYGHIEIRAQLPAPRGFWPAFWTWQAPGRNAWDETDVFEYYSDNHRRLYQTKHPQHQGCVQTPAFDPSAGMHTYGADSRPDGTTFYVDGVAVCAVRATHSGAVNMIVDNFVYSVIPPAAASVGVMKVDYARAWQR